MDQNSKIYIAGHNGLVGSALLTSLKEKGYRNLILREEGELDLTRQEATERFIRSCKPEYVFICAARVGGIHANRTYPADFYYINAMIANNLIHSAYQNKVTKLLFLGSSCIYPREAPQPLKEDYLLSGKLESTNEPYAIAKIAGLKMCEYYKSQYGCNFISAMPTNLYGPNDNFNLNTSHVLPALIRKFHDAKINKAEKVVIWGTGKPRREFLYIEDLAEALIFLMQNYNETEFINVGTGEDITIHDLALMIKEIVGFQGNLEYDSVQPDGTPRKLLEISRLRALGWEPKISLRDGIRMTYQWFTSNRHKLRL
ncbi:GDP-L-fucose synthase [bacterium]|nr:GDP-L-fucose synthase [bacterium]